MSLQTWFLKKQFTRIKQQDFLKQLYQLVKAGVPPQVALRNMRNKYRNSNNTILEKVVSKMYGNLNKGKKIAEDMQIWLPFEVCQILITAEEQGILLKGLKGVMSYYKFSGSIASEFKGLIRPLLYLLMAIFMILIVGNILTEIVSRATHTIPLNVKIFLVFYNIILKYNILIIIAIFGILFLFKKSLNDHDNIFYKIITLPIFSIYRANLAFSLLNVFSLLLQNQVKIGTIINMLLSGRKEGFFYSCIKQMGTNLRIGISDVGKILDTGIFTKQQIIDISLIADYAKETDLAIVMHNMATNIENELISKIKILSQILNLLIMMLISGLIILAASALYGSASSY